MAHPLEGVVSEIERQIKERKFVHLIIDKETIDKMRMSLRIGMEGAGGIDRKLKDFGVKEYSMTENIRWISSFVRRKIKEHHKLRYYVTGDSGTDIHILSNSGGEWKN